MQNSERWWMDEKRFDALQYEQVESGAALGILVGAVVEGCEILSETPGDKGTPLGSGVYLYFRMPDGKRKVLLMEDTDSYDDENGSPARYGVAAVLADWD